MYTRTTARTDKVKRGKTNQTNKKMRKNKQCKQFLRDMLHPNTTQTQCILRLRRAKIEAAFRSYRSEGEIWLGSAVSVNGTVILERKVALEQFHGLGVDLFAGILLQLLNLLQTVGLLDQGGNNIVCRAKLLLLLLAQLEHIL